MISLDITLLFQLVNFLVTLALLNWLIIGPVRRVMAERRARNDGLRGDTGSLNDEAARKLEDYEARLLRARAEMAAVRDEAKQAGEKDAQGRLESAGEEARVIRREAADRLHAESADARRELDAQVGDYARLAVDKLLGA